ncbi:hypothetical protein [Mesonia sp. K4-1]|uniref:hypothetical protein n=1 Tax=Mesonia sp. K4-1 TaxID=2602760 RepID=UPI0011CBB7BF|nr:hypothetical protein [Mesonia sp. K4-1]TXK78697.1 hypothetical protein FT986_02570 [Mesonia sp. K4-1]
MRFKELKIRFVEFTGGEEPSFTITASIIGHHTFKFVTQRQNDYEVTIGQDIEEQNQYIKEAFDLDLVPLGYYETELNDGWVYLYINNPLEQFYFCSYYRCSLVDEINNDLSYVLGIISTPPPNVLLNAYNDNIVLIEKGESSRLETTFNGQLPITLYPSPLGEYYLNLKYPAATLINQNKFEDSIVPDIENNGYVEPDESLFLEMEIEMVGYVQEQSFTQNLKFEFIKAVEQIANFKDTQFNIPEDKYYLLLPQLKIDDVYKVNYYEGYPVDISLFSFARRILKLKNLTTGHETCVTIKDGVNRLFLSQGSEDFTINDVLPMQTGINKIELIFYPTALLATRDETYEVVPDEKSLMLYIIKKESTCAPYFKFYRNRGGWGYIRFEREFTIVNKVKEGKDVTLDFNGIQNTLTRNLKTERESTIEMEFQTEKMEAWEMQNFKDFIKSPRVEMYVGDLFQKAEKDSWVGINVKSNSLDNKSLKTKFNREKIKIEFNEYNMFL